jgi:uncharacterized membrane protein YccC
MSKSTPRPQPRAAIWRQTAATIFDRPVRVLKASGPGLLFGLRMWASICIALYVAFRLELDNAYWAATTAAFVCQPHLGASLRKGWYRMIGTLVGAVAIVVLTACFPQDRILFLASLALWAALCAFIASALRNFAAYAATLAGFTATVIALDQLGSVGGLNGQAFTFALARVSEIFIGIVSAGIVVAGTDFGAARLRLASSIAQLSVDMAGKFVEAFELNGKAPPDTRAMRRDFLKRVTALDPIIDETIGESSEIRYHSPILKRAVDGLFLALSAWRAVANHLVRASLSTAEVDTREIRGEFPLDLRARSGAVVWASDSAHLSRVCDDTANRLATYPAGTPSVRLLADQTVEVLVGLARALDGLTFLVESSSWPTSRRFELPTLHILDWLPAAVNAIRVFLTIGGLATFWIVSGWPDGATAMTWAALTVGLFGSRAEQAYGFAFQYAFGTAIAAILTAIIVFAVLPQVSSFFGFCLVLGAYFLPVGALTTQPRHTTVFAAMVGMASPLIAPANQMSYDTAHFYNAAAALVIGVMAAAASFRLVPPLTPAFRTRRLLARTRRDLRDIAAHARGSRWDGRVIERLADIPEQATPLERAQVLAAVSAGMEIQKLRQIGHPLRIGPDLEAAFAQVAARRSLAAIAALARVDAKLMAAAFPEEWTQTVLRARGHALALAEVLRQHGAYFDGETPA